MRIGSILRRSAVRVVAATSAHAIDKLTVDVVRIGLRRERKQGEQIKEASE